MDDGGDVHQSLIRRVQEVERERDELKKDLEQLCLHQTGPSLLGVATKLHFQRTAGLEQEIDTLKKRLGASTRENRNLHEELSEAYRIKGQLADLYSAEASKNNEMEKQVKFFQGCLATAFAERDHALMESEKITEHEEAILRELDDSRRRIDEIDSVCEDLWRENASLQTELQIIKEMIFPFEKVVSKFSDIREIASGLTFDSWEEKCACLLNDSEEMWSFDEDRNSSTSQHIASLEEKIDETKKMVESLQSKIRVGLEIEQHLKRKAQSLEKKIIISNDTARDGILKLRDFHLQIRYDIMTTLQEANDEIRSLQTELQKKLVTVIEEQSSESAKEVIDETGSGDLNMPHTVESAAFENSSVSGRNIVPDENFGTSDALALAMHEKVAALLLLSQQEERHLLERDLNAALQLKITELQSNLFQVTHEKVKALMELADLKQKFQQLHENCRCGMKHVINIPDGSDKDGSLQLRDGRFKDLLKKTYLGRWIGTTPTEASDSIENVSEDKREKSPVDTGRSTMEATVLQGKSVDIEELTSSIHSVHLSLLKTRHGTLPVDNSILKLLDLVRVEADRIKVALGASLPVSSSVDAGQSYITTDDKFDQSVHDTKKPDVISAAGIEMAELLILLAELLKENKTLSTSASEVKDDCHSKSDEG